MTPRKLLLAALAISGCASLVDAIPPRALTATAVGEIRVRIAVYLKNEGTLPTALDALPMRQGYANRITDGWGRPLIYEFGDNGFVLTSLGKDGMPGGSDDDADSVTKFRVVNGKPEEIRP